MVEETPQKLSESACFELLAERRRRQTLRVLRTADAPLTTTQLAERIAAREYGDPTIEDVRPVRISLHHQHLPRLADADVVTYDRAQKRIRIGRNFDDLVRVLSAVTARIGLHVGGRCSRCDASTKTRVEASEFERPVCLRCERQVRGT